MKAGFLIIAGELYTLSIIAGEGRFADYTEGPLSVSTTSRQVVQGFFDD